MIHSLLLIYKLDSPSQLSKVMRLWGQSSIKHNNCLNHRPTLTFFGGCHSSSSFSAGFALSPVQTIQHSIQHCIQQMLDDYFTPRLNDPTMLDEISPRAKKRPGTEFTNVANYKQRCYAHARFQQLFSPRPNDPTMRWIIQHFWSHSNSIQHLLDGPTWWPNDPTFAVQHLLDAMLDAMLDRLDRALKNIRIRGDLENKN